MLHSALLHATCCRIDNFAAHAQATVAVAAVPALVSPAAAAAVVVNCQLAALLGFMQIAAALAMALVRGETTCHDHDHCPATAIASASAAQLLSSSCSGRLISIANIFTYSQCQLPQRATAPSFSQSGCHMLPGCRQRQRSTLVLLWLHFY